MTELEIEIRPLRTQAELHACVELQRDTWGRSFSDVVPASILKVSQRVGGVAAGAFDSAGRLVGFVFGITGVERGRIVHWSDMLAVRPEARDLHLGRRLKEYQRQQVAAAGGELIYWTYDPLVARNAHLNFVVLGARAVEYVQDMYGEGDSDLHRGIGTDRFIVGWPTDEEAIAARVATVRATLASPGWSEAPIVNAGGADADVAAPATLSEGATTLPDRVRIAVPLDIHIVQQNDPSAAARWRHSTRSAFFRTVCADHDVAGFVVDEPSARGYYLLERRG
jgi:chorismate synthase